MTYHQTQIDICENLLTRHKIYPSVQINEYFISKPVYELAEYSDKQINERLNAINLIIRVQMHQETLQFYESCADKMEHVIKYRNCLILRRHKAEQEHVIENTKKIKMKLVDRLPFELLLEIMGFAGDRAYIKLFIGRYNEFDDKGVSGMMRLFSQIKLPRLKSFIRLTTHCYNGDLMAGRSLRMRSMNKTVLVNKFIEFLTNTEEAYENKAVILANTEGVVKRGHTYYNITHYEAAALYLWRVILLAASVNKKKVKVPKPKAVVPLENTIVVNT